MKKILVAVWLLAVSGLAYSVSSVELYDAEGDFIGTVTDFEDSSADGLPGYYPRVLTRDGYFMTIDIRNGEIMPFESVYFTSSDCAGQPYLTVSISTEIWLYWLSRGGFIFRTGGGANSHARVPLGGVVGVSAESVFEIEQGEVKCWRRGESCGGPAENCPNLAQFPLYYPVDFIDDAQYGLGDTGEPSYGFLPPLEFRVEQSDVIFCSGFECPQQ